MYDWPAANMDKASWDALRKTMRDQEAFWNLELQLRDNHDREAYVALSGRPVYGTGRTFEGYSGIGRDITPQKVAERLVIEAERIDRLTKLPNRQSLLARLPLALASSRRRGSPLALLMLGVVGFEQINRDHGILTGDQILTQLGQRLRSGVRETDMVARMEGDQFAVLLEDVGAEETVAKQNAQAIAAKLQQQLQRPYLDAGHTGDGIALQIRVAIATADSMRDTTETLLGRARAEMIASQVANRGTAEGHQQGPAQKKEA